MNHTNSMMNGWRKNLGLVCSFLVVLFGLIMNENPSNAAEDTELYEDSIRESKESDDVFFRSKQIDFIQIPSSLDPDIKFAILVHKPEKPSPIMLYTHGWHMSVRRPTAESENPYPGFLSIQVDMRGRAFSTGHQDANGYELYDVYDALQFARQEYPGLISDPGQVYFKGGSGGGGNALGLAGKFPDLFVSITALCGISDYAHWYKFDDVGEFRDELEPWIGSTPDENPEAYASRSGITTVENILSPVYLVHGETDVRVPSTHSRNYYKKAKSLGKNVYYLELESVGTRSHFGNATEEQMESMEEFSREASADNIQPPKLPESGELVVAGYVVTKPFSVFLDSIDHVGRIRYDLKKKEVVFLKGSGSVNWKE